MSRIKGEGLKVKQGSNVHITHDYRTLTTDFSKYDTTVRPRWGRIVAVWAILIALMVTMFSCQAAHAGTMEAPSDSGMDTATAMHAIANEAGGSYAEMRAIAWAIANRGYWRGVYGLKRPLKADSKRLEACLRAWTEVGEDNHGGNHWLSDYDLKYCKPRLTAFRFSMQRVGYWGTTHFYKS